MYLNLCPNVAGVLFGYLTLAGYAGEHHFTYQKEEVIENRQYM